MIIDCDRCDMRETRTCDDCVISVLVGDEGILSLLEEESDALETLSVVGLVPPIRHLGDGRVDAIS